MRNKGKLNTWYALICHVFWFQEPHYNKKRHNCRPKATLESWAKDWWQASKEKNISYRGEFLEFPGSLKGIFNTNQKGKQLEKTCHVAAIHHESNWVRKAYENDMRNTMKYCTTEDTSSQHSQPICRQKCQCIKTFMSILDLQSEGRWHILRNASHAWSHLDYLNASKTFWICPKCINTPKIIQKDLKNKKHKKGCFLGCNSCSITELQGTQRYPKNLSYHLSMTFGDSTFTNNFWPHLPSIFEWLFSHIKMPQLVTKLELQPALLRTSLSTSASTCWLVMTGARQCPTLWINHGGTGGRLRTSATTYARKHWLKGKCAWYRMIQQSTWDAILSIKIKIY